MTRNLAIATIFLLASTLLLGYIWVREHYVLDALTLWEPRIEVGEVRVQNDDALPSRVLVQIEYTLRATNDRRNLVFPFYTIPDDGSDY